MTGSRLIAQRVQRVALDRSDALLRHVKRRRDVCDLLGVTTKSEMPADDLTLARGQRLDGVIDLLHPLVLDGLVFRIAGRAVGDEGFQGRAVVEDSLVE